MNFRSLFYTGMVGNGSGVWLEVCCFEVYNVFRRKMVFLWEIFILFLGFLYKVFNWLRILFKILYGLY